MKSIFTWIPLILLLLVLNAKAIKIGKFDTDSLALLPENELIGIVPAILSKLDTQDLESSFNHVLDSIPRQTNIAKIVTEVLNCLPDNKVDVLIPSAVTHLNLSDIPALSPYPIKGALPHLVSKHSVPELNQELPDVLHNLPSTSDLGEIIAEILNSIDPSTIPNVSPDIIKNIDTPMISLISPAAVKEVVPIIASNMLPASAESGIPALLDKTLDDVKVSKIVTVLLESLTDTELAALSPLLAPYISVDDISSMSPDTITSVVPALVEANPPTSLEAYIPNLIGSLPNTSDVFGLLLDVLNFVDKKFPTVSSKIVPSSVNAASPSFDRPDLTDKLLTSIPEISPHLIRTLIPELIESTPLAENKSHVISKLIDESQPDVHSELISSISPILEDKLIPELSPNSIFSTFPTYVKDTKPDALASSVSNVLSSLQSSVDKQVLSTNLINNLDAEDLSILTPTLSNFLNPSTYKNLLPQAISQMLNTQVANADPSDLSSIIPLYINSLNDSADLKKVSANLLNSLDPNQVESVISFVLSKLMPDGISMLKPSLIPLTIDSYIAAVTPEELNSTSPSIIQFLPNGTDVPSVLSMISQKLLDNNLPAAPVGEPVAPVGEPVAPVGEPVTPVGEPVTPVGEPVTPVGEPVAPVDPPTSPRPSDLPPNLPPICKIVPSTPWPSTLDLPDLILPDNYVVVRSTPTLPDGCKIIGRLSFEEPHNDNNMHKLYFSLGLKRDDPSLKLANIQRRVQEKCDFAEFAKGLSCQNGAWVFPSSLVLDPGSTKRIDKEVRIDGSLTVGGGSELVIASRVTVDGDMTLPAGSRLVFECHDDLRGLDVNAEKCYLKVNHMARFEGDVYLVVEENQIKEIYANGGKLDIPLIQSDEAHSKNINLRKAESSDSCFYSLLHTNTHRLLNENYETIVTLVVYRSSSCEEHFGIVLSSKTWTSLLSVLSVLAAVGILVLALAVIRSFLRKRVNRYAVSDYDHSYSSALL